MLNSILKSHWAWWAGFAILFIPLFMFMLNNLKNEEQSKNTLEHEKEQSEIRSEVARRAKARAESETPSIANQTSDKRSDQDVSHRSIDRKTTDTSTTLQTNPKPSKPDVITEGPHKGMTLAEFEAHKKRGERLKAVSARMDKHTERLQRFTTDRLQSSRNEDAVMLSLFKTLSPEQLKYAKEYALNSFPPEEVNELFDAISNADTKTLEEIGSDADSILMSDAAAEIIRREIKIESEAIRQEYIAIYGAEKFEQIMKEVAKTDMYKNNQ